MANACFRLRFREREIWLGPGTYLIGRGTPCDLRVDDPRVSRRHAELVISSATRATIRDAGSTNGVFVNGVRLAPEERLSLGPGIRAVIGSEVIEVQAASIPPPHRDAMDTLREEPPVTCAEGRAEDQVALRGDLVVSTPQASSAGAPRGAASAGPRRAGMESLHTVVTSRTDALETYAPVARSAIAMGRVEDAEALMSAHLRAVLSRVKAGGEVPQESVSRSAEMAVDLARAGRPGWFEFVVDLYDAYRGVPPAHVVSGLERALEQAPEVDPLRLSRWVQKLRTSVGVRVDDLPRIERIEAMLAALVRRRRS